MDAFEVLVRHQAAPKNSWSNTLYSEAGKYTFRNTESGRWQMHLIDDAAVDASLEDIANWMLSGTPVSYTHLDVYKRQKYIRKRIDITFCDSFDGNGRIFYI